MKEFCRVKPPNIEILALSVGLLGSVYAGLKLNEASGLSFLGGGLLNGKPKIALAHNCKHELDVFAYVSPKIQEDSSHERLGVWTSAFRLLSGSPIPTFDGQFTLHFMGYQVKSGYIHTQDYLECDYIAIDIDGELSELTTYERAGPAAVFAVEVPSLSDPGLIGLDFDPERTEADAIIQFRSHDLRENISFLWKGFYRHLGDYKLAAEIRKSDGLEEFDTVRTSEPFLHVQISPPSDYQAILRNPDPETMEFSNSITKFEHSGDFVTLSKATGYRTVFEADTAAQDKEGRLILLSTLLGLFFGLFFESVFALLRRYQK